MGPNTTHSFPATIQKLRSNQIFDDNKEIPLTVTNMILILRLRHVFVVIKRPLTKNSRSVPNPAPIVARIEPKSSSWSPVSSIAEHCLEFLMCHRGKSAALSTTPLYTTADSISWLPYRMVHRIYKSKNIRCAHHQRREKTQQRISGTVDDILPKNLLQSRFRRTRHPSRNHQTARSVGPRCWGHSLLAS